MGNPIVVELSKGNINDCQVAVDLLSNIEIKGTIVIGDRGYDTDAILNYIEANQAQHTIPPRSYRAVERTCDWWIYKERHLVECFFNKLKNFRRVATRYDKLASSFLAFVHIASICILSK